MIPLEKIIVLSQIPIFSKLRTEELNTISTIAYEVSYEDGHILFDKGDTNDRLFIIVSGEVLINKNQDGKEILIDTRKENDFLGELSLFNDKPDITSASCSGKCTFLIIAHNDMERLIREYPAIALGFIKVLIIRMCDMTLKQTQE